MVEVVRFSTTVFPLRQVLIHFLIGFERVSCVFKSSKSARTDTFADLLRSTPVSGSMIRHRKLLVSL